MKAKELYLTYVWKKIKNYPNLVCYVGVNNTLNVCDKNQLAQKNDNHGIVETLESFIHIASLRKEQRIFIYGFSDAQILYQDLYIQSSVKERAQLIELLHQFCQTESLLFNFLKNMSQRLTAPEMRKLWLDMSSKSIQITNFRFSLKETLNLITTQLPDDNKIVFDFIKKHIKVIIRKERRAILLRDYLIEHYENEYLEQYAEIFPMMKQYLMNQHDETQLDIFEKDFIKEIIYIEINIPRLKAKAYIPKWTTDTYLQALKSLLDILYKQEEEIREIRVNKCKEEKEEYFSIFINKKETSGLTQTQIEALIVKFFKELTDVYESYPWKKEESEKFISLWLEKLYLSEKLKQKNHTKKPIQKI